MITDYRRPTRIASLFGMGLAVTLGCVALSGAVTVDAEACPPEKAAKAETIEIIGVCGDDAPELTTRTTGDQDGKRKFGWVMKKNSDGEGWGFVPAGGSAGKGDSKGDKKLEKRFEIIVNGKDGDKIDANTFVVRGDDEPANTYTWKSDDGKASAYVWRSGDADGGQTWRSDDGKASTYVWRSSDADGGQTWKSDDGKASGFVIRTGDADGDGDGTFEIRLPKIDIDMPKIDLPKMNVGGSYKVIIAGDGEPKVFSGDLGDGSLAIGKAFEGALGLLDGKGEIKIEGLPGMFSVGKAGGVSGSASGGCDNCTCKGGGAKSGGSGQFEVIRLGDSDLKIQGLPSGADVLRKVIRLGDGGAIELDGDNDFDLDFDVDVQVHGEVLDSNGQKIHVFRSGGSGSNSNSDSKVIRLRADVDSGGQSSGPALYEFRTGGQGSGSGGGKAGGKGGVFRYEIRTDGDGGTWTPKIEKEHRVIRLGDGGSDQDVRVEVLVSPEGEHRVLRVPDGQKGDKKIEIRLEGDGGEIHDLILGSPDKGSRKIRKVRRDLRTL